MNSQVCVNCFNKKAVNQTDNRLVTESCGHIKCMDCLLHEKSGCLACLRNESEETKTVVLENENKDAELGTTYEVPIETEIIHKEDQIDLENLSMKKLEYAHIKIEMDGGKRCYTCTICKKKFYSRSQVCYHAFCNGQKKPHHCQQCKQSFASLSHYKYHMRVHNQERSYTCEVCGAAFYQMSKLKRHRLKHTKEKNYPCNECSKAFNNHSSLRKHMLTHTQERPYVCATCGRRFRDGSNYKKHVDKHKKRCTTCGEELREDAGEHRCRAGGAGLRAHACPRCRKAFHSRKDMRRHAAIHSDSKPFRCKACPEERRFRRKDNLERHIRNAHPDCAPSAAAECDLGALQSVARHALAADDADPPAARLALASPDHCYDRTEKIRLEILNPLPPLPQEVIRQHIDVAVAPDAKVMNNSESVVDKKSIIEANNARESVIVEKRNTDGDKKVEKMSPENEYVHKIRKAIIPLPPIDQEKFRSVQRGLIPPSVTTAPSIKNMEIYKKILYEKIEKDTTEVIQNPKMHWRRKMEQDIN
ncbi:zinc finger protein 675-like [Vanessa tameamea]|uniref:Zinc finger protein 675-like n=1 Tax=Vanessa tameamea TaxID=334116 RepID=A0A8B8IPV5_VANTA|nr:zinc finger protein 675-like [Vanessa tameamea]